jgi:murein tripeptide amidase MpaA
LITEDWYEDWYKILKKSKFLKSRIIGYSVQNRPIKAFFSNENINNPYIFILGRQHPPEVSSVFAIKGFVNELIGNIDLSEKFLLKYNIFFVPLMNPDGVENGFWRYNYNKKDLNRDWDNFFQPETYSVKNFLDNLKNRNQPILYIDFHSTYKNVFYISDAELKNSEQNFLLNWLEKSRLELSKIGYNFSIKESYTKSNKISKNYFHNKYNIPSMTYEVSDTEERSKITKSSKILARNLITILLDPEN